MVRLRVVDDSRYEVRAGSTVLGFIDVVGSVFVALSGPFYSHAVEVHQSLQLKDAVRVLSRNL